LPETHSSIIPVFQHSNWGGAPKFGPSSQTIFVEKKFWKWYRFVNLVFNFLACQSRILKGHSFKSPFHKGGFRPARHREPVRSGEAGGGFFELTAQDKKIKGGPS